MQKEGQLICHLKRSDVKSVCFFVIFSQLLKSHKGIFRLLKCENCFLKNFSLKKTIPRYLNVISPPLPLPPSLFFNKYQSNCYYLRYWIHAYDKGHNKNEKEFTVMQIQLNSTVTMVSSVSISVVSTSF